MRTRVEGLYIERETCQACLGGCSLPRPLALPFLPTVTLCLGLGIPFALGRFLLSCPSRLSSAIIWRLLGLLLVLLDQSPAREREKNPRSQPEAVLMLNQFREPQLLRTARKNVKLQPADDCLLVRSLVEKPRNLSTKTNLLSSSSGTHQNFK